MRIVELEWITTHEDVPIDGRNVIFITKEDTTRMYNGTYEEYSGEFIEREFGDCIPTDDIHYWCYPQFP